MKINDGNIIQGLYNANTAPIDVLYTVGDIVLMGLTLFTCKGNTNIKPSLTDPNWEVYMGEKWKLLNSLAEIEAADPNYVNYIGPNGLSEYFKSHLGGLNSNGRVQVLSDPATVPMSSLTKNSVYQLSYEYLTSSSIEVGLPFLPDPTCAVVIRTLGELDVLNGTIFSQEIIVYPQTGIYSSWVRSGVDLSIAVWSPTRGESFNDNTIIALNNIVANYQLAKMAYDTLTNSIDGGNYYSFIKLDILSPRNSVSFSTGTETIDIANINLNSSFHYKIFIRKSLSPGIYYSSSIDITPEDLLSIPNTGNVLSFRESDVTLSKTVSGWNLSVGTNSITRILKAKNLIS